MRVKRQTEKQQSILGAGLRFGKMSESMYTVEDESADKRTAELNRDEIMDRNDGIIDINNEWLTINTFDGAVSTNNGTIKVNGGTVTINNGTIKENGDVGLILTNNGMVATNNGDIGKNCGAVRNTDCGVIDENGEDGTVLGGKIGEMKDGTATNCTIARMTGGTARGAGTTIELYEKGKVSKAVSIARIKLAQGLTDKDIEWVESLPSEFAGKRGRRVDSVKAV